MKRLLTSAIYVLIVGLTNFTTLYAQAPRLTITSITGIPTQQGDTITDTTRYTFSAVVQNTGGGAFQGAIDILAIANPQLVDTLAGDSANFILTPGSAATLSNPNLQFRPTYYDGGDNIIVVWPAARGMVVPADSITLQLYYLRLTQSAPETRLEPIRIRPNPATDHILLETGEIKSLEWVRIYDTRGAMVRSIPRPESSLIQLGDLPAGLYLLEITQSNGARLSTRLIKE